MAIIINIYTKTEAPPYMYWVYTKKGACTHQTTPGAVVNSNPYLVPSEWVQRGLVTLEAIE